jgi:Family of unknown function (DUF5678)
MSAANITLKTLNKALLAGIQPGRWVAISEDQEKVVGTGTTLDDALLEAREQGHLHPFVVRVPAENSALIL